MKRLLTIAVLAACAAVLVAGAASAGVTSKAGLVPDPPADTPPPEQASRDGLYEFNTGGELFTPATLSGSASGWAYYILHRFVPEAGWWWFVYEFGLPTNQFSSDPIEMPVEWVADTWVGSVYAIENPYYYDWEHQGTFYPAGEPDTNPPDTYTIVDVAVQIGWGQSMVWGYENAGLCGMTEFSGVETVGWYRGEWDSDASYGRTALMQFLAFGGTSPAGESSLSEIKSLY